MTEPGDKNSFNALGGMRSALNAAKHFMEHYKAQETPQYVQICEALSQPHLPPDRASEPNILSFFDDFIKAEQALALTDGTVTRKAAHTYNAKIIGMLKSKLEKSINLPAINPSEIRSAVLEEAATEARRAFNTTKRRGMENDESVDFIAKAICALKAKPEKPKDNLVPQSQENAVGEEK